MDDDGDDKDDTKRRTRNLSEKKRRDQFNMLVHELGTMVSTNNRKMDKSSVLKSTISFLKNHNEVTVRSRAHDVREEWKPAFFSNEEFTYLVLEALEGFVMVFSSTGRICYVSESIMSILGLNPASIVNRSIFDYTCEEDRPIIYNLLQKNVAATEQIRSVSKDTEMVQFEIHLKRGSLNYQDEMAFELVTFIGHFRTNYERLIYQQDLESSVLFVGTGRLRTPQLIRDVSLVDPERLEFTSRHSLEWKFLFLDHRAPPIIGYLPFEVLGTSGYDYYHFDDLEKVVKCHEELMQKGVLVSDHYRFLTKGQQWIWLETRFYISYHQWNSKPEFVVCNHRVISYADQEKTTIEKVQEVNSMSETEMDGSVKQAPSEEAAHSNMSPSYLSDASDAFGSSYRTHSPGDRRSIKDVPSDDATMPPMSPSYMSEGSEAYASSYHSRSQTGSKRQRVNEGVLSDDPSMAPMSPSYMSEASETYPSYTRMHSQPASVKSSGSAHEASWRRSRRYATCSDTGSMSGESRSSSRLSSKVRRHHSSPYDRGSGMHHSYKGANSSIIPQHGIGAQYLEPVPYVGVPAVPTVLPVPIRSVPVIVSQDQAQIQEQLQRKHEELQQMIVRQQEELEHVKEQLLLARLGILQPVINVPYTNAEPVQQLQINQAPPQPQITYEPVVRVPTSVAYPPPPPPHPGQHPQTSQASGPQNHIHQ